MIIIEAGQATEEEIMELVLDYDVEDVKSDDGNIVVTTMPESFQKVSELLQDKNMTLILNEVTYVPQTTIALDEKRAEQCLRLIELLEDQDDVQHVYSNYDIADSVMAKISEGR